MAISNVMHTSNPKRDYRFSIENFQWTSKKLCGPSFSPIPGFRENFCFEIEYEVIYNPSTRYHKKYFHVRLVYLNAKDLQMYVSANIIVSNTQGILFRKYCNIKRIEPITSLIGILCKPNQVVFFEGLQDSNLKLEGSLTFSGYNLSTSVSVDLLAMQHPSGNCACRELVKDFKAMYESGRGSDVAFTIGTEKLRAHKAILASRSPVFAKMFDHDMLENNTNNVTIEDIDYGTFNDFLLFLYTGVAEDLKYESAVSLYSVSKKYQVESLKKICVLSLSSNMTVDYFSEAVLLADLYEDEELKEIVRIFAQKNFLDLVVTTKWAELITSQPELVKKVRDFIKPMSNN